MAMAVPINVSVQAPWPRTCSKAVTRLAHGTLPYKETCYFKNNSRRIQKHGLSVKRKAESTLFSDRVPVIEVMQFLEELTESMGENVKFSFGHICEGDEYTAGVKWHLEWKKSQIPFTRGSSFFECSKGGDRIIIKKAQVVIESPIKPGSLVLTLLKTVTSLFDEFPKATECM
ncbi:hypothetical protein SO802_033114 [Lithocarpus litseifolius]|uniref:SnoaL-like domain-containing protein n=1 Tax=Lithocarpus litseifolius TaxID=425828 RepID=A0AAW2BC91_9ROSI